MKTRLNALERVDKRKAANERAVGLCQRPEWGEDCKGNSESSTQLSSKGPSKISLHLNETQTKNRKKGMYVSAASVRRTTQNSNQQLTRKRKFLGEKVAGEKVDKRSHACVNVE